MSGNELSFNDLFPGSGNFGKKLKINRTFSKYKKEKSLFKLSF